MKKKSRFARYSLQDKALLTIGYILLGLFVIAIIVPEGSHWNDVRAVSENVGVAIVEAFRKVENANSDKLQGIFGDGAWTNKNRLPDRLLKDLLEHFSTRTLSIANCPEDELGQGYEYLIKKFADDSGHTAQEFYTNRTVVHLMTEMLRPAEAFSSFPRPGA